MARFVLIALLFLVACVPPQGGTLVARDTGLSGSFTRQIVISDHPHHVLMGHLIDTQRGDARTRALVIGQRRDGVHRLVIYEAWHRGVELPFRRTARRLDGCTHGHCRDRSVGMIFLSEPYLAYAAQHGLSARLVGRTDAIDIHVPASLFAELGAIAPPIGPARAGE